MVQSGSVSDPDSLLGFLGGPVRHGLAQVDLPLLAHARAAVCDGDYSELVRLDYLSSACRAPFELREAASPGAVELKLNLRLVELRVPPSDRVL